jgi:hypothetical protein
MEPASGKTVLIIEDERDVVHLSDDPAICDIAPLPAYVFS